MAPHFHLGCFSKSKKFKDSNEIKTNTTTNPTKEITSITVTRPSQTTETTTCMALSCQNHGDFNYDNCVCECFSGWKGQCK